MADSTLAQTNLTDTQDAVDAARAYILDAMTMCQTLALAADSVAKSASAGGVDAVIDERIGALGRMAEIIYNRLDPAAAGLELQVAP